MWRYCAVLLASVCGSANAQGFPAKPLRFPVGYAPGGDADMLTRMVARKPSERIGQQVVIDNRASVAPEISVASDTLQRCEDQAGRVVSPQGSM